MLLFLHILVSVSFSTFVQSVKSRIHILKLKMSNINISPISPQLLPCDYVQGQETDDKLVIVHSIHSGKDLVIQMRRITLLKKTVATASRLKRIGRRKREMSMK